MMLRQGALALAALALAAPGVAQDAALSPAEIVEAAPTGDWVTIAPENLLVMTLASDAEGNPRKVVIQLIGAPFSQGWVDNIRTLARAEYWDGMAILRVQDNYVAQWGQPDPGMGIEPKPVPEGMNIMDGGDYTVPLSDVIRPTTCFEDAAESDASSSDVDTIISDVYSLWDRCRSEAGLSSASESDPYTDLTAFIGGWAMATDFQEVWPVHCYGMVGVGRGNPPDTGDGSQLYAVIGHAPRHLDRNLAVVGRVVEGIEHLSSLPRGKGPASYYEDPAKRVPILSVRIAADLPKGERPGFEYLSTESASFADYADARANRRDPFFVASAGGADICNIPVPIRSVAE